MCYDTRTRSDVGRFASTGSVPLQLVAAHARELELLSESLGADRDRQQGALREKLAAARRRRLDALRRKQEAELMREAMTQKQEANEVRAKHVSRRTPTDYFVIIYNNNTGFI